MEVHIYSVKAKSQADNISAEGVQKRALLALRSSMPLRVHPKT